MIACKTVYDLRIDLVVTGDMIREADPTDGGHCPVGLAILARPEFHGCYWLTVTPLHLKVCDAGRQV